MNRNFSAFFHFFLRIYSKLFKFSVSLSLSFSLSLSLSLALLYHSIVSFSFCVTFFSSHLSLPSLFYISICLPIFLSSNLLPPIQSLHPFLSFFLFPSLSSLFLYFWLSPSFNPLPHVICVSFHLAFLSINHKFFFLSRLISICLMVASLFPSLSLPSSISLALPIVLSSGSLSFCLVSVRCLYQ